MVVSVGRRRRRRQVENPKPSTHKRPSAGEIQWGIPECAHRLGHVYGLASVRLDGGRIRLQVHSRYSESGNVLEYGYKIFQSPIYLAEPQR